MMAELYVFYLEFQPALNLSRNPAYFYHFYF